MSNVLNADAKGVFVIAVTPFTESGAPDLASTDRMVDFYLESGATGLTILGILGEATKLTAEESRTFVKRVLARVAGRVPVVVGGEILGLMILGDRVGGGNFSQQDFDLLKCVGDQIGRKGLPHMSEPDDANAF